jgi:uncharacterized membrane protein YkgB
MSLRDTFEQVEEKLHGALVRHSITALRLSVGAVFLGFGALKFFPGVSPAQGLSIKTIELLTFGLVPWRAGLVAIAALECFIGVCLLAKRWMRLAVWLLAIEFVGILAPLVLLTARLFSGPHHAPTLEGQYVLKDFILVAAGMAIAAGTFRGGRLVRDEPHPTADPGQATLVRAYERDRTARAGVLRPPISAPARGSPAVRATMLGRGPVPGPGHGAAGRRSQTSSCSDPIRGPARNRSDP